MGRDNWLVLQLILGFAPRHRYSKFVARPKWRKLTYTVVRSQGRGIVLYAHSVHRYKSKIEPRRMTGRHSQPSPAPLPVRGLLMNDAGPESTPPS